MKTNRIALFDFDGTLTKKDSLACFIRYACGDVKFYLGMTLLSPIVILYKLKLLNNSKAKQIVISYFFKGWNAEKLRSKCQTFSLSIIPRILRKDGLERLKTHIESGDRVVVITASPEDWIKPWTDKMNIELIGTKLEKKEWIITGNFCGKNCYGKEKVVKLREAGIFNDDNYVYAYGDTKGDWAFLSLANEKFYKYFKG